MRALLLAALMLTPSVAGAQAARDGDVANAATADMGVLRFQIDEGCRIVIDHDITDRVLTIQFWRQSGSLAAQLSRSEASGLSSFSVISRSRGGQQLDLRLDDAVRGTEVVRRGADILEIQFSSQLFAGAAVRVEQREAIERSLAEGTSPDKELQSILDETLPGAPDWIEVSPFYFPVGMTSPVHEKVLYESEGRRWGFVPTIVRAAWATDEVIRNAVSMAEAGQPTEAAGTLHRFPTGDDAARTLLALARGWIWSQAIGGTTKPASPGRASEALQLAASLAPKAPWAPWALGRAAYNLEWEMRYDESMLLYKQAITAAPHHTERPHWEVGSGVSLIGRGRYDEGIRQITEWLGGMGPHEEDFVFEARRAVLYALWEAGEPERAARVLDLLRQRHPTRATETARAVQWAVLQLEAGRYAEALPHLAIIEDTADRRVVRERARWWAHEAALGSGSQLEARRALRRLIEKTPGSALGPLAKVRLQTLDLLGTEPKDRKMSWPQLALVFAREAMLWPNTVLELEALSMTAQIYFDSGLLEDGLHLYSWIENRGGVRGGATAFDALVCLYAPIAFKSLRARGHTIAALGIWRTYLEGPEQQACVDPQIRAEAASTALTSDLPDLALNWLGKTVAEGQSATEDAANLITMANVYLQEGRPKAARRTLRFVESSKLPADPGKIAEAWGDVLLAEEKPAEAAEFYDTAIREAGRTVKRRAQIPNLRMSRGTAHLQADNIESAEEDIVYALQNDGTDSVARGWLVVADIRQERAEARSDPSFRPNGADGQAAWQATLEAADLALAADPLPGQARAATWHRASALLGLEELQKADELMAKLAQETDAWGLLAKNRRSSLQLEREMDDRTKAR